MLRVHKALVAAVEIEVTKVHKVEPVLRVHRVLVAVAAFVVLPVHKVLTV